jgi:hypothetical protein
MPNPPSVCSTEDRPTITEIWYRWQDGREELRYSRPFGSADAINLIKQVEARAKVLAVSGETCPYFVRNR